jgi:hypothetical protein
VSTGGVLTGGPGGAIRDRDTAGSPGDRTTPRTSGVRTY